MSKKKVNLFYILKIIILRTSHKLIFSLIKNKINMHTFVWCSFKLAKEKANCVHADALIQQCQLNHRVKL